jgi:hypothetical protein
MAGATGFIEKRSPYSVRSIVGKQATQHDPIQQGIANGVELPDVRQEIECQHR